MLSLKITESIVIVSENKNSEFLKSSKKALELLIATPEGSVPLDRKYGLNQSFLSLPPGTAETIFAQELIEKAELYLPEISITDIYYKTDNAGYSTPVISVCKNEDYEQQDESENLNTNEDDYYYDDEDPDADNFIESEDDE